MLSSTSACARTCSAASRAETEGVRTDSAGTSRSTAEPTWTTPWSTAHRERRRRAVRVHSDGAIDAEGPQRVAATQAPREVGSRSET